MDKNMSAIDATQEERQAWDRYFTEALANTARVRAAAIVAKTVIATQSKDELFKSCADMADEMLKHRRKRFK